MQLRMLEDYNNALYNSGNTLLAGETYEIDDEHAAWLIEQGKAETAEEAAAEDAAEVPLTKRGRKKA